MYDPTPDAEEPREPSETIWMRLLWLVLIAILIGAANTVQMVLTIVQFVIMAATKGEANENIAELGNTLGNWIAKAVKYQTAASSEKPWPWTPAE